MFPQYVWNLFIIYMCSLNVIPLINIWCVCVCVCVCVSALRMRTSAPLVPP